MGADNMAVEKGMNPPIPRFGDRIREVVGKLTNRGGGQGVMQASGLVEAPPKPKTGTTDKSKEEADELIKKSSSQPPEKPKKPSWVRTKAGRIGLTAVGALGSIGVGVGVAHQINPDIFNRPEISRPSETAAPNSFSNRAEKGVIDANNTITMSMEEIQQKFPKPIVEDRENSTATIVFPLKAPEGTRIGFDTRSVNPKDGNVAPDQDAIINTRILTVPKGTEIVFGADGRVSFHKDGDRVVGVYIAYYDEEQDILRSISVGTPLIPSPYSLDPDPSIEMAFRNVPRPTSGNFWESFPMVKKGTVIATTNQEQPLSISISAVKGKDVWKKADKEPGKRWILSPQFLTDSNGSGVGKLVVLANEK